MMIMRFGGGGIFVDKGGEGVCCEEFGEVGGR